MKNKQSMKKVKVLGGWVRCFACKEEVKYRKKHTCIELMKIKEYYEK